MKNRLRLKAMDCSYNNVITHSLHASISISHHRHGEGLKDLSTKYNQAIQENLKPFLIDYKAH